MSFFSLICEANNRYMKDYDRNKESQYLKYWYTKYLNGTVMSQKLLLGGFKCVENTFLFNKNLIES